MIGTHNSMTYLPPRRWWLKPFTFLWRCQDKTIEEQKKLGVTYLDIRIRLDSIKDKWFFCHGIVDVGKGFNNIGEVIEYLESTGCEYRLILERGNDSIKGLFIHEIKANINIAKHMVYAGIKKPWTTVLNIKSYLTIDYSYVPFYTGKRPENASKFNLTTIKKYAKKHNPVINKGLINSKIIYFMDYVGINNN